MEEWDRTTAGLESVLSGDWLRRELEVCCYDGFISFHYLIFIRPGFHFFVFTVYCARVNIAWIIFRLIHCTEDSGIFNQSLFIDLLIQAYEVWLLIESITLEIGCELTSLCALEPEERSNTPLGSNQNIVRCAFKLARWRRRHQSKR